MWGVIVVAGACLAHRRSAKAKGRAVGSHRAAATPWRTSAGGGIIQESLGAIIPLQTGAFIGIGQTLDNHYQAFADPRASGNLGGFQGGIDLLRGSLIGGHYERVGLYGAYGDVNADLDGLVTNPAATAYVLAHTGSMNLTAWSAGGYWTHTGPGGWYISTPCCKFWRAAIHLLGRNSGRGS